MTKKDYIIIATALNAVLNAVRVEALDPNDCGEWYVMRCAERIAKSLHDDNPLFDERLFLAAVTK